MSAPSTRDQDFRGDAPSSASEKASSMNNVAANHNTALSEVGLEPKPQLHAKTFLAVFAVFGIYFAQVYCLVGAGAQGASIAAQFNAPTQSSWLSGAMAIFTVVLGPIVSQAADYWGRKWFLVGLSFSGALGALVTALATSMNMLIAGCCLIGTAFGMQPLLHAVVSEVLPRAWRGWAQSIVMMSNALGLFGGLVIGGGLNRGGDPDGFRYFFYIGMAFFLATGIICIFAYHPPQRELQKLPFADKVAKLDFVGYALLGSGLVLFCLGLFYSQNPYPWSDPHVSAPFAIGLALAIALCVYEYKFKTDGLNFGIVFLTYIPASAAVGLYCTKTKRVRWITVCAFLIFIIFFACMSTTNAHTRNEVWGFPVLMGAGLSMTLIALLAAGQLSVPPELIAVASGIMISMRSLGGTIGIAIYNAVFISETNHIPSNVASAALEAGLPSGSADEFVGYIVAHNETGLATIAGATPEIISAGADAALDTYAAAFRLVWLTAIPFLGIAAISAVFLFDPTEDFNNHIDAPVEDRNELYSK
ncbi:MFS general substrate transporter [Diaporthe eres]|nr:MFS general substrate transporter [Diaporthe eres]